MARLILLYGCIIIFLLGCVTAQEENNLNIVDKARKFIIEEHNSVNKLDTNKFLYGMESIDYIFVPMYMGRAVPIPVDIYHDSPGCMNNLRYCLSTDDGQVFIDCNESEESDSLELYFKSFDPIDFQSIIAIKDKAFVYYFNPVIENGYEIISVIITDYCLALGRQKVFIMNATTGDLVCYFSTNVHITDEKKIKQRMAGLIDVESQFCEEYKKKVFSSSDELEEEFLVPGVDPFQSK